MDGGARKVRRVLLVDDDAVVRRTVRRVLEREGIEVVEAHDRQSALDAPKDGVDVFVLDVVLGDGLVHDIVPALRRGSPSVPIVAASGLATREQAFMLRDLGVDALIEKPFTADALLQMLATLVQVGPRGGAAALRIADLERLHEDAVRSALERSGGNVSRAAELLGCARQDLQYWKKRYRLGA